MKDSFKDPILKQTSDFIICLYFSMCWQTLVKVNVSVFGKPPSNMHHISLHRPVQNCSRRSFEKAFKINLDKGTAVKIFLYNSFSTTISI